MEKTDYQNKSGEILDEIKLANKILLHLHPGPDLDSVGSALAMWHVLRGLGKDVVVMKGDSDLPTEFDVLPGFSEIVENNYFDINLDEFDLFIIQDTSTPELISRLDEVVFPDHLKTIVIDHHNSNNGFGGINLIDKGATATAEILFYLFEEWGVEITPEISINLLVALFGDTGGFLYGSVGDKVLSIASDLSRIYPDYSKVIQHILNQNKPEQLRFRGFALSRIKSPTGKFAYIALSLKEIEEAGFAREDVEKLSSMLLSVKDWLIGVTLMEKDPGKIYGSFRSKDGERYDVSKLAGLFGGGGHKAASGAMYEGSIEQAEKILLDGINNLYPDLK